MKRKDKAREKLFFLLWEYLFYFILGSLAAYILLEISAQIVEHPVKFIFRLLGYGIYYYSVTPFVIYWLNYVSLDKLTPIRLVLTVCFVGVYSYVIWDSYFFLKQCMQSFLEQIDDYGF